MAAEEAVEAFVEIPKGSRNKYEYDERTGRLRLDRVLHSPLHYPTDYGFLLGTLAEDGDHLDALIFTHEPTFPGCVLTVRPIGVLDMVDEKGRDQKVAAVPVHDPRFADIHDLADLAGHWLHEIRHFFEVYKTLEDKPTEILGWLGAAEARALVARSRRTLPGLRVSSGGPYEARVGYARAVRVGRRVLVSGTTALGPDGAVVGAGDPYRQTRQALATVVDALRQAGAEVRDVVRVRLYVTDAARWEEVARAYTEVFGFVRPAMTLVGVAALVRPDLLVEVEAEAEVAG